MIPFPTLNTFLVKTIAELPALAGARDVYLDFETSSGNPKLKSFNPWHNCIACGIAITVDDLPEAYYVPLNAAWTDEEFLIIVEWLRVILAGCENWINHNVKYDAHVAANSLGITNESNLICTLTLAKIIDSDREGFGGYTLDSLSAAWLENDISEYEKRLAPYKESSKDYGDIPIDIIGEYACIDVLTCRALFAYISEKCPPDCYDIWQTEIRLTRVLWEIERNGLPVDMLQLKQKQYKLLNRMLEIDSELHQIVGRSFRPHVSGDCEEILCNHYGLPVVKFTKDSEGEDTDNPSFDKGAMALYAGNPYAPQEVIKRILEYRELDKLNSAFVEPWQVLALACEEYPGYWLLHSDYNQCVRTARLACKQPNAQQLSPAAKALIPCPPGFAFITADASQIEFRFIVHYIQDAAAMKAFIENPDTDFHVWVAEMCGIKRKPAKTVNFLTAFGGGKKKLLTTLTKDMDLVGSIKAEVDKMVALGRCPITKQMDYFESLAARKAEEVYHTYHSTLPGIKITTKQVEGVLKYRGYLRNHSGRHRHLPTALAYRGFNSLNQSSAADMFKERIVALSDMLAGTQIKILALVHDSVTMIAPKEIAFDIRTQRDIVALLESPAKPIRVPVRWAIGCSAENWLEADKAAAALTYDKSAAGYLEHLR